METNETLTRIFEESIKVFAHYGYKKASMEEIAGRMGMTKGNLYFYCKNKQDLYEKAVSHALFKCQDHVRNAIEREDDIVNKFVTLAKESYKYISENTDLRTIIMKDPYIQSITPSEDRFPYIGQSAYTILKNIIQQGVNEKKFRPIDVDHITGFLYSIYCMFIIKSYKKYEGQSAKEMYHAGIDVILKGLLNEK